MIFILIEKARLESKAVEIIARRSTRNTYSGGICTHVANDTKHSFVSANGRQSVLVESGPIEWSMCGGPVHVTAYRTDVNDIVNC